MALHVGETFVVTSTARNPVSGELLADLRGEVEFYSPEKKPRLYEQDRVADHGPYPASYDAEQQVYLAYVDTAGWQPGRWTYRFSVAGDTFEGWEYGVMLLRP